MIFYGKSGTGKTSMVQSLCNDYYGKPYSNYVLELNASDDRGINTIRTCIKSFASIKSFDCKHKIIILDEVDNTTQDAQYALRRIIEKYVTNVRFILICNYLNKIIPAIYSRCTVLRFKQLELSDIVSIFEKKKYPLIHVDTLYELADYDIRKMYNFFEIYNNENLFSLNDIYLFFLNIDEDSYSWLSIFSKRETKDFNELYNFFKLKQALNITNIIKIYTRIYLEEKRYDKISLLAETQYKYIHSFESIYDCFLLEVCAINTLL